jgi:hypothetical protein
MGISSSRSRLSGTIDCRTNRHTTESMRRETVPVHSPCHLIQCDFIKQMCRHIVFPFFSCLSFFLWAVDAIACVSAPLPRVGLPATRLHLLFFFLVVLVTSPLSPSPHPTRASLLFPFFSPLFDYQVYEP